MKVMVGCVAVAVLMFLAPGAGSAECWRACVNLTSAGVGIPLGNLSYGECICPDEPTFYCPEYVLVWDEAHGCMADEILVDEGGYECEVTTPTANILRFAGCDCETLQCLWLPTGFEDEHESDRCKACP